MDIRLLIGGYLYIAVVVIFGITILIKVIKKRGFTASDTTRSAIIFGIGFLYIIALAFYYSKEIGLSDRLQILLMFGLVAVTAFYAWSAFRQADANVKMAEEMANTRYDAFRPIIDIVELPMEPKEIYKQAFEAKEGKFPEQIRCALRNIGVGPAIGVSSFIIVPSNGGQRPWDFGTIAVGEKMSEFRLSPQQIGDRMFLIAYYKDVYGRDVESRRKVTLDKERHGWKIHPLETQVRKITKEGAQQ
jgi:hypothetical protein